MSSYQLITPPDAEPVAVATAKLWIKQDIDDDDALLAGLITAARTVCENYTQRKFVTQTWSMTMDAFPGTFSGFGALLIGCIFWGGRWGFLLPFPPVSAVVSVKYKDATGTLQTLAAGTDYVADLSSGPARIFPVFGRFWPQAQYAPAAVIVTFTCGYGEPAAVPLPICQAMLFLVSYWYTNRDAAVITTGVAQELPMVVKALLAPYCDWRF